MTGTVLLVGCGNMGHAMLTGWLKGALTPDRVTVVEPVAALRRRAAELGVHVHAEAAEVPPEARPDLVVLAVKPQVILDVAAGHAGRAGQGATFLSIAAGTGLASLAGVLGPAAPILRCMPNTPAAVGAGMLVCCSNGRVAPAMLAFCRELLAASGSVWMIDDETWMDAVTAVSGSGPAYVFHLIECLADAGVAEGLPDDLAAELAVQTVHGAGLLARGSETPPGTLRRQVTSPGGTTAAALAILMADDGLAPLMKRAVRAAADRSRELGKAS